MRQPASLSLATLLLAGCTTQLDVRPQGANSYATGIPIVLPFTQYEVTGTWRLTSCTDPNKAVTLAVQAEPRTAEDESHRYLIDPSSLQRELTTAAFHASYFENSTTLRTVNAEVDDRTGPFIGNVAKLVATIAPLAMGVPVVPRSTGFRGPPRQEQLCTDQAVKDLASANRLKTELDDINAQVAAATDEVLRLAAAAAQMGGAVDPETSAAYGQAIDHLTELTSVQEGIAGRLAEALRPISFQRVIRWPETSAEFDRAAPLEIDPRRLTDWFGAAVPPQALRPAFLRIEGARAGTTAVAVPVGDVPESLDGIPFRVPRPGRLVACDIACGAPDAGRQVLLEGPIAQLGTVNVLAVTNPAFASTSVTAEFRPDGSLASAGYAQKAAPLEKASAAIAGAAGEIVPVIDPTQRLARETAYLNALKERRDAWQALQPPEENAAEASRAALEADTSLVNAQISNLQARLTLQELQARSNAR